jgi:hypothetical protein
VYLVVAKHDIRKGKAGQTAKPGRELGKVTQSRVVSHHQTVPLAEKLRRNARAGTCPTTLASCRCGAAPGPALGVG